jgi:hypothetical protein
MISLAIFLWAKWSLLEYLEPCMASQSFTRGLVAKIYKRQIPGQPSKDLIPDVVRMLGGKNAGDAGYVDLEGDGNWWKASGQAFFRPDLQITAAAELTEARRDFFQPRRFVDPLGNNSLVDYDQFALFPIAVRDALGNLLTCTIDYRVLQPNKVTNINGNRSEVAFAQQLQSKLIPIGN